MNWIIWNGIELNRINKRKYVELNRIGYYRIE